MQKDVTAEKKTSSMRTDKKIETQNDVILFPRKVEEAKQRIAKYGLPDAVKKKQ